jgi:germination protein M
LRAARLVLFGTILLSAVVSAGGCGGGNEAAPTTTTTTTTVVGGKTDVRVYWLRAGMVWPVRRTVQATDLVATGAVAELLRGPSQREKADLKATTAIPDSVDNAELNITDGAARAELSGDLPRPGICQLVYTLTQFPDVQSVAVKGKTYTRASCEDVTPAILVESPLPFDEAKSQLHVTGTANTFEATFQYELRDTDGKVVGKHFVTATSGTGTRGTFDFTTERFRKPYDGGPGFGRPRVGELVVYELSAENGQRIHLVEIPLHMKKSP